MFTIAKIRNGETYLDHHLSANDYYTEKESVDGVWMGSGAKKLGIEGKSISAGDTLFENFRNNIAPDGSRLTERGGEKRIRFLDIQCGAPKSVSIQAITVGDFRLQMAHERAVDKAYEELEKFAGCQVNTLTERRNRLTGNLVTARFCHTASRALDPQLHDHLVTVSATFDETTGKWKALTEFEIFQAIKYCGRVYQNELAKECRRLGYELRPAYDNRKRICGFELVCVSDNLVKRYSKRRAQIEKGIEYFKREHGREPSSAEIHTITCQTRDPKLKEATTPEVIEGQRAQLSHEELSQLETSKREALIRALKMPTQSEPGLERESLRHAIANTFERAGVVHGHELMASALTQNLGKLDLAALRKNLTADSLVQLNPGRDTQGLDATYTTPAGLRRERWVLAVSAEDKGSLAPLAEGVVATERLSESQRRVVEELLSCRDRLACLRGVAGTGKTTVLAEADRLLRAAGREVVYCAPTGAAKEVLKSDGMKGAETVAGLLAKQNTAPLKPGTVLVVDEAGMLSMREGKMLLQACLANECRLLLVGDSRQHSSVEEGDFLRHLEKHAAIHRVELTDIRRQQVADYKDCVKSLSEGRAREGLEKLDTTGRLHENVAEYLVEAAKTYVKRAKESGVEQVIGVAPTWEEGRGFTASIRQQLKHQGQLGSAITVTTNQSLGWTDNQRRDVSMYSPGLTLVTTGMTRDYPQGTILRVEQISGDRLQIRDAQNQLRHFKPTRGGFEVCESRTIEVAQGDRLLIQANSKEHRLTNGTLTTVASVAPDRIELSDGRNFNPGEFSRFTHGYVVTSHQSQGKTADHVVVAAATLDAKSAYVAASRGRKNCDIHTPDKAKLLGSLPDGERTLATEVAVEATKEIKPAENASRELARILAALRIQHPLHDLTRVPDARHEGKSLAREPIGEPTSSS